MKKNVRQYLFGLFAAVLLMLAVPFQSFAANAKIAFSDPSTQVGEEVKVTMKFTSTSGDVLGNTDVMLAYDANLLEFINETENASGGSGAIRVWSGLSGKTEIVTVLRFKALQAGTANITVTSWEGYDNNGQLLTMDHQGSSKVTIKGLATSSTDATLQSLQVSPGTLSPSFTPATTEYTVNVGLDTEKLTVSAKANNDKASVAVQGGDALQEGENTVVCTVTAQDGTTVGTYTIVVNKSAAGEAGGDGDAETGGEPEVLAELDVTAKKLRIIELPEGVEVPEGFKESSIAIGDTKVTGWTWAADTDPRYCVFYGMNEAGDQDFYRYDLKDKTIQRYFVDQEADPETSDQYVEVVNKYNSLVDDYSLMQKLAIGLGVAAAVLLILVIVLLFTRRGTGGEAYEQKERKAEPKARSRSARGKKLSKEERYMMGEEADYEEDPDHYEEADSAEAYQPEEYEPDEDYHAEIIDARVIYQQAARGEAVEETPVKPEPEKPEVQIEEELARSLAQAAAAGQPEPEPEDEDDFEIFDLDDSQ